MPCRCWFRCRNVRTKLTKLTKSEASWACDQRFRLPENQRDKRGKRDKGCLACSLSLLRGCRTVQSMYKAPPDLVASKTATKAQCNLAASPPSRSPCSRISIGGNLAYGPEPTSTGDKRDNMSTYALRISDCPVCHPASVILWPRLARAFR